jgi:hypothetical protein
MVYNVSKLIHATTQSRFRGGGKGSDEEHITYSGGQEIFDLLRCGWEEKNEKKEKKKKRE